MFIQRSVISQHFLPFLFQFYSWRKNSASTLLSLCNTRELDTDSSAVAQCPLVCALRHVARSVNYQSNVRRLIRTHTRGLSESWRAGWNWIGAFQRCCHGDCVYWMTVDNWKKKRNRWWDCSSRIFFWKIPLFFFLSFFEISGFYFLRLSLIFSPS